jgi:hypothetical protein
MVHQFLVGHVDQIGLIFAYEAVDYIDFFEIYKSSANFWDTFFRGTSYVYFFAKKWVGYILGAFFQKLVCLWFEK